MAEKGIMTTKITMTKKEYERFQMGPLRADGFNIKKNKDGTVEVDAKVKEINCMFRRIGYASFAKIEFWRFKANSLTDIDKNTFIRQCTF